MGKSHRARTGLAVIVLLVVCPVHGADPQAVDVLFRQAEAALEEGRTGAARQILDELLAAHPDDAQVAYRVTVAWTHAGRWEEALDALGCAFDRGYGNFEWVLEEDPELASLRRQPAFRDAVLSRLRLLRSTLRQQADEHPREAPELLVRAAQLELLDDNVEGSLEMLGLALARGFDDFRELEQGPGLARLRDDPRYVKLVNEAFLSAYAWTGTDQQKIAGLMTVYAEVEYNFVFTDRLVDLGWDKEVEMAVPSVLGARSMQDYYRVLAELVARLGDGHTGIAFPRAMTAYEDRVPVAVEPIGGRFVITRAAATRELGEAGVLVGDALVSIDGVAVDRYLEDRVLRFQGYSTRHAALAYGSRDLLLGNQGSVAEVVLERPDGRRYLARLTRDSRLPDGSRFDDREAEPPFSGRELTPGVHHLVLRTFADMDTARAFADYLDALPPGRVRGLILDLRRNSGGDAPVGWRILSRLVDRPLETAKWRTPSYRPALRAWGRSQEWYEGEAPLVQPARGSRFLGPLVVLTSAFTYSAAEDFCVPLKHSGRAVLVGEPTGGSTGQPLKVYLPGGGSLRVCTKHDRLPDGTEFIGLGIQPDVRVEVTVKDVQLGRDLVLERAVEIIEEMSGTGHAGSGTGSGSG